MEGIICAYSSVVKKKRSLHYPWGSYCEIMLVFSVKERIIYKISTSYGRTYERIYTD